MRFVLIILAVSYVASNEIPPFINVCHRSDPDLEKCMIQSIEKIRPLLVTGVPEYNIPSIEPLVMQDLICEEAAGMKIITTNVSAYGCSDFVINHIEIEMDDSKIIFKMAVDIPKLRIEAAYNVDGKILLLPVRGDGNLEANVTDCKSICTLHGELFEKDGETYMKYVSIDLHVKVGGGKVRMENLFNGDKILLGMMNDVVNKNLDAFLKELMPVIEKGLARTFLDIGNGIVQRFTLDQLFPQ